MFDDKRIIEGTMIRDNENTVLFGEASFVRGVVLFKLRDVVVPHLGQAWDMVGIA